MSTFTVQGKIVLRDGDTLNLRTEANHELFIVFREGVLTVCNESGESGEEGGKLQMAVFTLDGDAVIVNG